MNTEEKVTVTVTMTDEEAKRVKKLEVTLAEYLTVYLTALDSDKTERICTLQEAITETAKLIRLDTYTYLEKPTDNNLKVALLDAAFITQMGILQKYPDNIDTIAERMITLNEFITHFILHSDGIIDSLKGFKEFKEEKRGFHENYGPGWKDNGDDE